MRKQIIIVVLFVLSCTNNFQSHNLKEVYTESLNFLFEKNYFILLEPPGPPNTAYEPKLRYHQVSNKWYDLSYILEYTKDDKLDVSRFVEISTANFMAMDIINSNAKLSKMDITDNAIKDKRKLKDYFETVKKEHSNFGGTFVLGKPLINGDLSNGELIISISKFNYASSTTIAAWVKIKDNKIVKIENLDMQLPFQ